MFVWPAAQTLQQFVLILDMLTRTVDFNHIIPLSTFTFGVARSVESPKLLAVFFAKFSREWYEIGDEGIYFGDPDCAFELDLC